MTAEAKKLLVKSVTVLVIFSLLFFGIIMPKLSKVRKLAAEVRVALQENQRLQTMILTSKNAGDRLDEIQGALKEYQEKALHQEDLPRVLEEIGTTAQENELRVESLRALDEPRKIPGEAFVEGLFEIQQVSVSLKAEGTYPQILGYLQNLEAFPYSVVIQNISLKNMTSGVVVNGQDPELAVDMTMAVLMRVPPIQKKINARGGLS